MHTQFCMLLDALRTATRPHHDAIESQLNLLHREWNIDGYRDLLAAFYGFIATTEPRVLELREWSRLDYRIEERRKVPLLLKDLGYLSRSEYSGALPLCPTPPPIERLSQALGYLYVIEGATLGGQLISRHFQQTLDIYPDSGGAYFYGYGQRTGEMWRETTQFLNQAPVLMAGETQGQDVIVQDAVESACETFIDLRHWMATALAPVE